MNKLLTLLIGILLLTAAPGTAQERKLQNRPYIDSRRFHYGFLIGIHMQDLEMENNGYIDPKTGNRWYADVDNYNPGFSVGVLGEMRLSKHFALRLAPTINFGQKHITFHEQTTGRDSTQNMRSTYISVPLDVKFSAPRYNNYRPYFIAGINPMVDLTVKDNRAIVPKRFDCFIEVGMGCDFYLPFFKFIPELKFCFGLANVLKKDRKDLTSEDLLVHTRSLNGMTNKMIVLTFYFE